MTVVTVEIREREPNGVESGVLQRRGQRGMLSPEQKPGSTALEERDQPDADKEAEISVADRRDPWSCWHETGQPRNLDVTRGTFRATTVSMT